MRILVLQLARFGDIYQSWPTLRALHRKYPHAEVHVLVRSKFRAALDGLGHVTVHTLPTQEILQPVLDSVDVEQAHERLKTFLLPLHAFSFDLIVNLSFSPVSSYLTDFLAHPQSEVRGYTRHSDGHLHIPDDTSAYFYAQVGIERANRYHISEIFGAVAGVDLSDSDYVATSAAERTGTVVHLGASVAHKMYPADLWIKALVQIAAQYEEPIYLVGGAEETNLSQTVQQMVASAKIVNRVGQTSLRQTADLIAHSRLLIGADSAPIHMAALAGTPVLNLSSSVVNFWETGPVGAGSRILFAKNIHELSPETVATEALNMLAMRGPTHPCIICEGLRGPYRLFQFEAQQTFAWNLIQALYTDASYPAVESQADRLAFQRLNELAELALQQLERWTQSRDVAAQLLQQVDSLIPEVGRLSPAVEPVVQWFQTQRLRIPPGSPEEILAATQKAYRDLHIVSSVYYRAADLPLVLARATQLCQSTYTSLRDCDFHLAQDDFQSLLSTLHELARHSTKVAGGEWSTLLQEIDAAMVRRDFVHIADVLQWRLLPSFQAQLNETETFGQDVLS